MPRSLSKGPDHSAAINGSQLVPEPPRRSTFNGGGGGPELFISFEQIWTVHERARRSTVHNGFRTPPAVLPLTEGGGSGIVYKLRADLDGSKSGAQINGPQWIPDPPLRSTFNGRGGVRNQELKSTLI
jgi:hypothetical protein